MEVEQVEEGTAGLSLRVRRTGGQDGSDRHAPWPLVRPSVVVGIRDLALHQEVLDFLERDARLEIAAAADDPGALSRALLDLEPRAILLCPAMAQAIDDPRGDRTRALVVVTEELTVSVLRDAIDLGARGVFAWPDERTELAGMLATAPSDHTVPDHRRARVVAVLGARGGAGATFVASQLAATVADRGGRSVVVDLDLAFAGLTVSLGIPPDAPPHTVADLVPVLDELDPDHVTEALYRHPRGFEALLSPPDGDGAAGVTPGLVRAAIALLAADHDVVVLHAPRTPDAAVLAGVRLADVALLITTQDLFSLHGAKRAIDRLGLDRPPGRCRVVLNRFTRAQIPVPDVARILGVRPWATIRFDPAVRRSQDRGRLLPPRAGRSARDVRRLATMLAPQGADGDGRGVVAPGNR
jgi:pilus assembly protein CpaE